jgi:hypothetical protein
MVPEARAHIHDAPTGDALDAKIRPTTAPSVMTVWSIDELIDAALTALPPKPTRIGSACPG